MNKSYTSPVTQSHEVGTALVNYETHLPDRSLPSEYEGDKLGVRKRDLTQECTRENFVKIPWLLSHDVSSSLGAWFRWGKFKLLLDVSFWHHWRSLCVGPRGSQKKGMQNPTINFPIEKRHSILLVISFEQPEQFSSKYLYGHVWLQLFNFSRLIMKEQWSHKLQ